MANEEKIPGWCYSGGIFRSGNKPTRWLRKQSGTKTGQWYRNEMVPYGKATPEYRQDFYLCPECEGSLEPLEKEYRFVCPNCKLIYGWSFGGLYGFGLDSDLAEYLE